MTGCHATQSNITPYRAELIILIRQHAAIALCSSAVAVTTACQAAMAFTSKDRLILGI